VASEIINIVKGCYAEISAGKGNSKYKIHITVKSLHKSEINRQIGLNNKVLIVGDSGIPKKIY
jgi:hypothetical protein